MSDSEQVKAAEVGEIIGTNARSEKQDPGLGAVQSERDRCLQKWPGLEALPAIYSGLRAGKRQEGKEGGEESGDEQHQELPLKVPQQKPAQVLENCDGAGICLHREVGSTESHAKGTEEEDAMHTMSLVERLALRKREAQESIHNLSVEARTSEALAMLSLSPEAIKRLPLPPNFDHMRDPAQIEDADCEGKEGIEATEPQKDAALKSSTPSAVFVSRDDAPEACEDPRPWESVGAITVGNTARGLFSPLTLLTPPLPLEPHARRLRSTLSSRSRMRESLLAVGGGTGGGAQQSNIKARVLWSPPEHQKTSFKQLQQQLQQAVATGHGLQLTWQVRRLYSAYVVRGCIRECRGESTLTLFFS